MPVKILCPNPNCIASDDVDESRLGRDARCTRCGEKFALIPATRAEPPASSGDDGPVSGLAIDSTLPASFGRFRVVRELGRGGMGTVYLAEDAQLGRLVAIKVPHPAYGEVPEVRARLLREARVAAQFHHTNFCPIHDIGEVDGRLYLRMSFIEGRTLASMIEPGRPWSRRRAVEVVRQLAVALAEAHRRGIIHRDLKPSNVMVDLQGTLVIMDFGLALRLDAGDPRLTSTGAILGTPAYMPPEQVEANHGAVGPRSDIYSLGVILYELLTARRPFEGSAAKVLGLVIVAEPPPLSHLRPEVDARLEAICLRAMAKRPGDRFATMADFASALQGWLDSRKAAPESHPSWPRPDPFDPSFRLASAARPARRAEFATLLVLLGGLATSLWFATLAKIEAARSPKKAATARPERVSGRVEPDFQGPSKRPSIVPVSTPTTVRAKPPPRPEPELAFEENSRPRASPIAEFPETRAIPEPKIESPPPRPPNSARKSRRRPPSSDQQGPPPYPFPGGSPQSRPPFPPPPHGFR